MKGSSNDLSKLLELTAHENPHYRQDVEYLRLSRSIIGSYLEIDTLILASQSIPSWNQIKTWLREMETLRKAAA